jgi:hypothetical protein
MSAAGPSVANLEELVDAVVNHGIQEPENPEVFY